MAKDHKSSGSIVDSGGLYAAAKEYVQLLGGAGNIRKLSACETQLRLELADTSGLDDSAFQRLGAAGVKKSGSRAQIAAGEHAQQLAEEMNRILGRKGSSCLD